MDIRLDIDMAIIRPRQGSTRVLAWKVLHASFYFS